MKNQQECPERPDAAAQVPETPVTRGARRAEPKRTAAKKQSAKRATPEPVIDLADFTAAERDRLFRLRRRVRSGERGETFPIDRRQEFVRWLVEKGKLSDN